LNGFCLKKERKEKRRKESNGIVKLDDAAH
jgi:hypothetical protein